MPSKPAALSLSDVLGLGRLAADAAHGVTGIVEHMHTSILDTPGLAPLAQGADRRRHAARLRRRARRVPADRQGSRRRCGAGRPESGRSAGVARPGNRARRAQRRCRRPSRRDRQSAGAADAVSPRRAPAHARTPALAEAFPDATGKLAVLVHGLCMSDLQWMRQNHDHGAALARDLGYTPVYLSYNSGLHVSTTAAPSPKRWRRWSPPGR